ncbi:MAG: exodeoxyribonuclease VII small subunit [Thermomicrobiales bacterium]|nr:exodeoxyribonuclease VII small subunit [Thermomicrobiales bacterium]MCO5219514.1 exodeoxyribonuclease VII small subunit [Thermomicrobiales bacterium]
MAQEPDLTFEAALERIREIVTQLESGDLSLDDSIRRFKDGSELLESARKMIAEAELRITVLTDEDGDDA